MKGQVVNLNRERWLALANLALQAAASLKYDDVEMLGIAAGKMHAATPPPTAVVAMTGCLTFRWACQHFAASPAAARPQLAVAVSAYAWEIRRIFEHTPAPPEAVSLAVPIPGELIEPDPPRWAQRADIGG